MKSCPFCRASSDWLNESEGEAGFRIGCDDCFAEGPLGLSMEHAQMLWERRLSSDDPDACPFCASPDSKQTHHIGHVVTCADCKTIGPQAQGADIAKERWRNRGRYN